MSKKTNLLLLLLLATGCIKNEKDYAEPSQAMFWTSHDLGCGSISVTCNGITHTFSGSYPELPDCGAPNSATFDLSPGVYKYTASCSNQIWQGNVTVVDQACTSLELKSK